MTDKIKTGNYGERRAAEFLINKGYEIVARNYRYRRSEIDLIAFHDRVLVFVEVKTRRSTRFGQPEEFVNERKAEKIREGAEHYIISNNWNGNIRFDIISIKIGKEIELVHFEDAIH